MLSRIGKLFFASIALLMGSSEVFANTYCSVTSLYSNSEYIREVKVNGVANASFGNNYSLITFPKFRFVAGVSNGIALTPGYSGYANLVNWGVWIDLNRDGIFSSAEKLFSGTGKTVMTSGISFPATVAAGDTRMRVMMQYGSLPQPCQSMSYGEIEDYVVNIASNTPQNQVLTFENLFGPLGPSGTNQQAGPTITVEGISITTTWPYFYQKIGAPFSSQFLRVVQPTFRFPAPVHKLSFQTSGNCNCTATYQVIADGVTIGTFSLNLGVLQYITIPLPNPARTVRFYDIKGASLNIDNFAIDYQPPVQTADQVLTFESLFGPLGPTGTNQQAGPTIIVGGVSITTTWPYFYQKVGAPFASEYLRVVQPTFNFPQPVTALEFQTSGNCNCIANYSVIADGVNIGTFSLSLGVLQVITINLPQPARTIRFYDPKGASLNLDNFAIHYQ